jgi:N-carbamoyl-L-amino-acid hydrolase
VSLSIERDRLYASLYELGRVGSYTDSHAGITGVNRLALTSADGEGRRHVVALMKTLGLSVTVDRIGNVYARRAGVRDDLSPVVMGSHVDSVQTAGRFDGCLGVLGGLEVVRTLVEHDVRTTRPVLVAFFTDEEGSRFGTDMLGSAVATGRLALEQAYALADRTGATVRGELERIGFLGEASERLAPPHAYLECHIEQGPILRSAGLDVGVVTGVQAICWHELSIVGRSAHAGTTPMSLRADPGVAAARIHLAAHEIAISGRYGDGMRATMGVINARPGLVNVVPSEVQCTVDLRNPDDEQLRRAEKDMTALYDKIAAEERVALSWRRTARTDTVAFSPVVQERVEKAASSRGMKHERIVSGAGHDAQEMARICPAGMVFVPGENDGISHNPRELSTPDQCANGVNVLLDVLLSFANEEGP